MNDAHVHEMQVQMWKPNTWGVTPSINKYISELNTPTDRGQF